MEEQIIDLLMNGVVITRRNMDGTFEKCSPNEFIGKDLEIVSTQEFSFQDIKNEFDYKPNIP